MSSSQATQVQTSKKSKGAHSLTLSPSSPNSRVPKKRGRDFYQGLGPLPVDTLVRPLRDFDRDDIGIKDLEYLGSYSWTDAKRPTIIVPGSPREWLDKPMPFHVEPDSGRNFIDQNGNRMGHRGLIPLIHAVEFINADEGNPPFDWSDVDFVTDRNGLRKLMRWANGTGTAQSNDFRIDTQLGGSKTVLLTRWEKVTREKGGGTGHSYGYNFEREATSAAVGCDAGKGYHRVVKYDLDGLKLVVRCEVDACLPPSETMISACNLDADFPAMRVKTTSVNVVRGGSKVPQSSLIEVKTFGSLSKSYGLTKVFPQLYLSQTPFHYVAIHQAGNFEVIRKNVLGEGQLLEAEQKAQLSLKKLRSVLASVQELIKRHGAAGRLTLICSEGLLKVYKRTKRDGCMPADLLALFAHRS